MIKRTLYFGNPAYLSVKYQQLVIKLPEVEGAELPENFKKKSIVSIPIEDIGLVVLDNQRITLTQKVLEELLDNQCAVITCNSKRMPAGMLLPLTGNHTHHERFQDQLNSSQPLRKQLWQQTIQYKIYNQAMVLSHVEGTSNKLMLEWVKSVRQGDVDNYEARAAAFYWKSIFPSIQNFKRGRDEAPPNNLLNYGYAILRAVVARSLVISGLLPILGIHHHNRYNPYCLADDIMEPYRPYVDLVVLRILDSGVDYSEMTTELKKQLLSIPTLEVEMNGVRRPLMVAVRKTTASLYRCFKGEIRKMVYPEMTS